ncbi:putative aliphatic sulfonates transport permease protein SsuC [Methylomusa anaerophila]|uniref:Putative aliphatic sulfonates transport permease protein SsuC n=2 Tax=Methylomusa anaerophila TaxID=1930071 RepID=A0A348AEM6_9FIRM|nr:putative aliphatic sulfonates transport permease protein SsuC [Methylomusa anaerophila]
MKFYYEKSWRYIKKVIAIGVVIALWEILPLMGIVDYRSLPPFSDVILGLVEITLTGELFTHMVSSLQRSLAGFVLAVALAVPLGILMGWFKRFERIVDPLVQTCRNTPVLALYPLFILFFGLGELAKISIIFYGSLWPILINTIEGVKTVDALLIKAARSMSISRLFLFTRVILPAAVPSILTGLRISATRSVIILVAAEMLGASSGLGFFIFATRAQYEIEKMYAGILVLIILGVTVNYLLVKLENYLSRWKENMEPA